MDLNCTIASPVILNCWKHHLGFIQNQIINGRQECQTPESLKKILLVIGESQMDIYLGKLSPQSIAAEIIHKLKQSGSDSISTFKSWLYDTGKDYRLLTVSDKSVWTIRLSNNSKRYVHIHPGRYSPHTVRVKALTLKTAIVSAILSTKEKYFELTFINNIRVSILNAPPLKSINASSGLGKFLSIITKERG